MADVSPAAAEGGGLTAGFGGARSSSGGMGSREKLRKRLGPSKH